MNATPEASTAPLRVLTPDLGERLQKLNAARYALQAVGLRIERQDVRQNSLLRPFLMCDSATAHRRLLLQQARVQTQNGVRYLVGIYMDCDVAIPMEGAR